MTTKPNLGMFQAVKGNASVAPLTAPRPVPTPANVDQAPPAEPIAEAAPEVEVTAERAAKPLRERTAKPPAPEPETKEPMVPLGVRTTADFRTDLKIYAATLRKSMQEVVLEGIELHKQKYGKRHKS